MYWYYITLPVIRTCTYSNNSVIRTEIAFPLDLLSQLRVDYSNSSYSNFQLFEPIAKSPSVIRILIIGRSLSENIDFLWLKHFFF